MTVVLRNSRFSVASSQPSGRGHWEIPSCEALFAYRETTEAEIDKLRAICRWLSFAPYFKRMISLSFLIVIDGVGILFPKNRNNDI